ncbi:MAG: aminopeptidase [Candidatus Bathyarchaeia archaeon]
MMRGALRLLKVCANAAPRERVLVVLDTTHGYELSRIMMEAASRLSVNLAAVIMKPRMYPGEEPPSFVVAAMKGADVVICVTSMTMFYTEARIAACKAGARFLSIAGGTPSTLASNAMLVDFRKQEKLVERIAKHLTKASLVHISTDKGTDIELSIAGREGHAITGLCKKPGDAQGVPDIEAYVAPIENSSNGTLVVDASTSVTGLLRTPITVDVQHGEARRIYGGDQAKRLLAMLRNTNSKNSFRIGEFGFGLNPLARFCGSIIEDEAVMGTVHIALGENRLLGGRNKAPIHVDLVLRRPRVELDGKLVLKANRLLI